MTPTQGADVHHHDPGRSRNFRFPPVPSTRGRRFATPVWATVLGLFAGALAGITVPQEAQAITLLDVLTATPRRVVSYCVESSPPNVSTAQAVVLLDKAIAHWEVAGGLNGTPAVDPSRDEPCQAGTDVVLRSGTPSAGSLAEASNDDIVFSSTASWWDGVGSRQTNEWAHEGIAVHEMGHTMGMGHAGDGNWTYDGGAIPSMAQCGSPAEVEYLDSIQQDDWGNAVNVGMRATGNSTEFWNANPGFEKGLTHWARSSSGITASSTYKHTGALGVRIPANNGWLCMTSVYDPYHPISNPVDNMDLTPRIHVKTDYRHQFTSTTGGVKVQYRWAYLNYDTAANCRRNADPDPQPFSGVITLLSCGDKGTAWSVRDGSVTIANSVTNPATIFRAYVRSTSSFRVYIDRTGAYGGT